ncbi:hypothetical protein Dimus_025819, partial [Dionaea muscipula]
CWSSVGDGGSSWVGLGGGECEWLGVARWWSVSPVVISSIEARWRAMMMSLRRSAMQQAEVVIGDGCPPLGRG